MTGEIEAVVPFKDFDSIRKVLTAARTHSQSCGNWPWSVGAVIERVWASPVMGVSSAFAFGENYGLWCGALLAEGITVWTVTPQTWQKATVPDITSKGADRKRDLRGAAHSAFGKCQRVTLTNCDALLISEYAHELNNAGKSLGDRLQ